MTRLSAKLHPKDLVDRETEQNLFNRLVDPDSSAMVMTIRDGGENGKSSLLKRLRYNCQHLMDPPVSVCLIELDRLDDHSRFTFVSKVVRDGVRRTGPIEDRFPTFVERDRKMRLDDFRLFDSFPDAAPSGGHRRSAPSIAATARPESMTGGINAAIYAEKASFAAAHREAFTQEQKELAKDLCVTAFFDDLRRLCATDHLVLLLDAWERCNVDLSSWLHDQLLGTALLLSDPRPAGLSVVIAGRPHHPVINEHGLRNDHLRDLCRSDQDFADTVLSVPALSEWEQEHVRQFMVVNGCPQPSDVDVNFVWSKLRRISLLKATQLINEWIRPDGDGMVRDG